MTTDTQLPLLNLFDIETDAGVRRLIGFLDPVKAGAAGIPTRSIVGGFTPEGDGDFDISSFDINPEFLAALTDFMNGEPSESDEVREQAKQVPGQWLYIIDPRDDTPEDQDPPASEVVGAYAVDETGQIVPNSFQYNSQHVWFSPEAGTSGLLNDRRFYDWLNS